MGSTKLGLPTYMGYLPRIRAMKSPNGGLHRTVLRATENNLSEGYIQST
jgi:hypothetical protein